MDYVVKKLHRISNEVSTLLVFMENKNISVIIHYLDGETTVWRSEVVDSLCEAKIASCLMRFTCHLWRYQTHRHGHGTFAATLYYY
jgi:hypothetical protein